MQSKLLVVSDSSMHALGNCFIRAGKKMGLAVETFDLAKTEQKYIKFGKAGQKIHTFLPVDAWQRKANRELAILYKSAPPDLTIAVGNVPLLFGTLAFLKSLDKGRLVLYWPDTLFNLTPVQKDAASLYDTVATYSSSSEKIFRQIGFQQTHFMPFAGDNEFLGEPSFDEDFDCDLSFAGGWRPEREAALAAVANAFPGAKLLIKGTDWERFCTNKTLLKFCEPKPVYGKDFGNFIRRSRINLNVIDETNYPAANMRFFEVPAVGGLQLSSACPEMNDVFLHRRDILYFSNEKEMIDNIAWVMENPAAAKEIRTAAAAKVQAEHTYVKRLEALFKSTK